MQSSLGDQAIIWLLVKE